jgi:hypothetical protein
MNAFWDFYWPAITFALVVGAIAGSIAFRDPGRAGRRNIALGIGIAGALAGAALWHGVGGTGERFAAMIEQQSRQVLVNYEMTQVQARVQRSPLARTVILSGPADDFQRGELVRIMVVVPGVARARWDNGRSGLPLLAEVELAALAGFGLGLLLAYLLELRRRYRAQWRW